VTVEVTMLVTGVAGLYSWCRRVTGGYPGVEVTNMTEDWRNGLAFCAVIHRFRPDLIDFNSLRSEDVYSNCALAFSVAETELDIPALLDSRDMKEMTKLDKFSIITYLAQFYHKFSDSIPQPKVRNSLVNNEVRNESADVPVDKTEGRSDSENVNYPVEVNLLSDADNTSYDSGLDQSIDQLVEFPLDSSTTSSPCLVSSTACIDSKSCSVSSKTESKSTTLEKVSMTKNVSATLKNLTASRLKLVNNKHSQSFESLVKVEQPQKYLYETKNTDIDKKSKLSKDHNEKNINESPFKAALKKFNSLSSSLTKEFEHTALKTNQTPKTLAKPTFTSVHVQTENTTVSQITQTDEFLIDKQLVPNCHKNNKTLAHNLLSNYVRYYSSMLGMTTTIPTPPCSSQYRNSDQSDVPCTYRRYTKPVTTHRNLSYDKQISDLVSYYQDPQPLPRPPNTIITTGESCTPGLSSHPHTVYSKNKQFKCVPKFNRTHSTLV